MVFPTIGFCFNQAGKNPEDLFPAFTSLRQKVVCHFKELFYLSNVQVTERSDMSDYGMYKRERYKDSKRRGSMIGKRINPVMVNKG